MSDRRRRKKRIWLIPLCAAALAAAAAGWLILDAVVLGGSRGKDVQQTDGSGQTGSQNSVIYDGKEYVYNDHLSNFLLLGVDKQEKEDTSAGQADAGQADAIYLLSFDRAENTVRTITIPRDTMTQIETFGPGGKSLGKSVDHISLSYSFGDGEHESCRLTKEAVSNLFYGLPIQGYCSISMDALPVLTESVGTLTVTVPNSSLEEVYPEFQEGSQVTLTPENTEAFVRYRDTKESQSALPRMERQQEFIRAFSEAAKKKFSEDSGYASDLYTSLEPYMVTSMSSDEFVKLAQSAASGRTEEGWTVPGEGTEGKSYDEYQVDDDALYEKIIETFYEEADP